MSDNVNTQQLSPQNKTVAVLPLRDVVVFPNMVIPLFVGREKSIVALDRAMDSGKEILLLAQKDAADDDPGEDDLYSIGTMASILQLLKLPDGTVKVLVEGGDRTRSVQFTEIHLPRIFKKFPCESHGSSCFSDLGTSGEEEMREVPALYIG